MTVLPASRAQKLSWFESRIDAWTANAAGINVLPAQMTAFAALIKNARAAFTAMEVAHAAAKSATQNFYNIADLMITPGRNYIATIKAFAESTHNPNVYVLSDIPPDAPPTPATAPTTPKNLVGSISTTGTLSLAWEAQSHGASTGIVFLVSKRVGSAGPFSIVGATFDVAFIDPNFNPSTGTTTYQVQAQRGGLTSDFSNALSVDLGLGGFTFTSGVGGVGGVAGNIGGSNATAEAA